MITSSESKSSSRITLAMRSMRACVFNVALIQMQSSAMALVFL